MKQEFRVDTVEGLAPVAETIIAHAADYPVILLIGEMGAGKTTLTKAIMMMLGVKETSSPTFSLVNQYDTVDGVWYHFDLYRINEAEELTDFGFEEYLHSGFPCMIEWPQIASHLIEPPYLRVELELQEEHRNVSLSIIAE